MLLQKRYLTTNRNIILMFASISVEIQIHDFFVAIIHMYSCTSRYKQDLDLDLDFMHLQWELHHLFDLHPHLISLLQALAASGIVIQTGFHVFSSFVQPQPSSVGTFWIEY